MCRHGGFAARAGHVLGDDGAWISSGRLTTSGRSAVLEVGARPEVRTRRLIGAAGLGVLLSGIVTNVYLAVVARALPPDEYVVFGAFWSVGLVVAFGAFLPVEQELARRLQMPGRRRAQLRGGAYVAATLMLATLVVLAVLSPVILRSFRGEWSALLALAALSVASAAQFVLRGTLIGTNRLVRHGAVMVLDSGLRLALAAALFLLGGQGAAAFCWALVLAVASAHVPILPAAWRRAEQRDSVPGVQQPDGTATTRSFRRATVPLLAGSLCAQVLLNGMPVLVAALATSSDQAAAGVFAAAFTLARAPLSIVVPLQSAVVPTLTRLLAEGRRAEVRSLLMRGTAALGALALLGMPSAALVGPVLVRLVFGARYVIGGGDLAIITGGVLAHVGLVVVTQVHVARARHRQVAASWTVALAAAAITFVLVPSIVLAAELGFAVGSLAGAVASVAFLVLRPTRNVHA